jgi:hypothetical protein
MIFQTVYFQNYEGVLKHFRSARLLRKGGKNVIPN